MTPHELTQCAAHGLGIRSPLQVYDRIVRDFNEFAPKLTVENISFLPLSALDGDNVVTPSANMPWYQGGTLLHRLETVNVGARVNAIDFRFPVQSVIRPHQSFRGYAGTVASGLGQAGRGHSGAALGHGDAPQVDRDL